MKRLLLLFILIGCSAAVRAQDDEPRYREAVRFGLFVGPQFNFHLGDYDIFEGNAKCASCTFENGDMVKFRFEGLIEYPASPSLLFSGRIGYQDYAGVYDRDVRLGSVAQPSGPPADLIVHQTFDNALSYITITPGVLYFPLAASPFHLKGGLEVGIAAQKSFSMRERIL